MTLERSRLYSVWYEMINRCTNPEHPKYRFYGGVGVVVCDEWVDSFKLFFDWATSNGYKQGLHLDKDMGGGKIYSPQTCRFVTIKENQRSRKNTIYVEYDGKRWNFRDLCDSFGLNSQIVRQRIRRDGLSLEEALSRKTGGGVQHFPRKKPYILSDEARQKMRESAMLREKRKRENKKK